MLNHPDMEEQAPPPAPGKLVLPALTNTPRATDTYGALRTPPTPRPFAGQFKGQVPPAQLIRSKAPPAPGGLLPKLLFYWRKDPAYKVFMLAVGMVVLASIVFVSMAGAALVGKPFSNSGYSQSPPSSVASPGTVDLRPTFSSPGGGKGSSQSSQPPAQSTPVLSSTPSGDSSPTPQQNGDLSAQITSYSRIVFNGSQAYAIVSTGQPGVTVTLYIYSNVTRQTSTAGPQTSDNNGNAFITWQVFYNPSGHRVATLTVVAVAIGQNGQQSHSAPVTIQVLLQGM